MQRAGKLTGPAEFSVQRIGASQGPRIRHDDRVYSGPISIVCFDSVEVCLNELSRCQRVADHSFVHLGDGNLH